MRSPPSPHRSAGFTIVEVMAAVVILALLMVLVAELGYWSMTERRRAAARQVALEAAGNVLESARALPWEELTPEWAAAQQLPAEAKAELPDGSLRVVVEPEKDRPRTKRVLAEVRWQVEEGKPSPRVELAGLFSTRAARVSGGKP